MRKHKDNVKVAGPSGNRPNRFFGQSLINPVGVLATRANLRKNFHDMKAQMRRLRRQTKTVGDKLFVLHETKGWMSARIAQ